MLIWWFNLFALWTCGVNVCLVNTRLTERCNHECVYYFINVPHCIACVTAWLMIVIWCSTDWFVCLFCFICDVNQCLSRSSAFTISLKLFAAFTCWLLTELFVFKSILYLCLCLCFMPHTRGTMFLCFMPHTRGTVFYAPYEGYYVSVLTPCEGPVYLHMRRIFMLKRIYVSHYVYAERRLYVSHYERRLYVSHYVYG